MVVATKGSIQLQVKVADEIKITPLAKAPEFFTSAKLIARSFKAILKYYIASSRNESKVDVVRRYFKMIGWQVEG